MHRGGRSAKAPVCTPGRSDALTSACARSPDSRQVRGSFPLREDAEHASSRDRDGVQRRRPERDSEARPLGLMKRLTRARRPKPDS
jgi:hypothetical protein